MPFNPVDTKVQDLIVIHSGTYLGGTSAGNSITVKAADLASVKGGLVACMTAANEVGLSDGTVTKYPIGLFIGDGANENDISVVFRGGIYETTQWKAADIAALVVGSQVAAGTGGKMEAMASQTDKVLIGIVTKKPATTSDTLGIKLVL